MFDCIPSGVVGGGRPQETNLKLVLSRFVFIVIWVSNSEPCRWIIV